MEEYKTRKRQDQGEK